METGGFEYYLRYRKGTHELVKALDDDNDEVVFTGNYEKCIEKMAQIRTENFDYDYNL